MPFRDSGTPAPVSTACHCRLQLAASKSHRLEDLLETEFRFLVGFPAGLLTVECSFIFASRGAVLLSHRGVHGPSSVLPVLRTQGRGARRCREVYNRRANICQPFPVRKNIGEK